MMRIAASFLFHLFEKHTLQCLRCPRKARKFLALAKADIPKAMTSPCGSKTAKNFFIFPSFSAYTVPVKKQCFAKDKRGEIFLRD